MIVKIPVTTAGVESIEKAELDISTMGPVCTIMVGRLDDG
jgi:hypothetical protein